MYTSLRLQYTGVADKETVDKNSNVSNQGVRSYKQSQGS
jgi:hypothetical protein